jgi:predicted phosphodiesterase
VPKIAHISDIHFGKTFDVDIWNRVRNEIRKFKPELIVASGDFSDHPDPLLLLAAKCELNDLCADCGADAELFVVPGNHDVLDFGNVWRPGGSWWFERVMFRNVEPLRKSFETGLQFKLGLNADTWHWANTFRWKRLRPKNWIWRNICQCKCDGRLQSCDYHRARRQWPTQNSHRQTLIACFNSNSSLGRFSFATGDIGGGQITRLGMSAPTAKCPSCSESKKFEDVNSTMLRVAVLHHHALPIAVPTESLAGQGSEARLEPFLVLRNAGDFVRELQRQKFDLVLHGHKHRPQFAWVQLRADDPTSYPLLVLAGGSTAKKDELASYNTLRLIGTDQNGRLKVETYEQGRLMDGGRYREPMPIFKNRTFVRAMDRSGLKVEEYRADVKIDGVGHLQNTKVTTNLSVVRDSVTLEGLKISVAIPSHDTLLDPQVEELFRDVAKLFWRTDEKTKTGYYWLQLNEQLHYGSEPATFATRDAAANSIAMTRWEIDERRRKSNTDRRADSSTVLHEEEVGIPSSYYEEVGSYICYAIEKFVLNLYLPAELDGLTPEVRCQRHPNYPVYPLTYMPGTRLEFLPDSFPLDEEVTAEESKRLRYDATNRCWTLEVDRPIAGYVYSVRWGVPNPIAERVTVRETRSYQKRLLELAAGSVPGAVVGECQTIFGEMSRELMKRFRSNVNPQEQLSVFLMIYDEDQLCLRPVFQQVSKGTLRKGSYDVPLGGGVAGAAFLQRRILAWDDDPNSQSLIRPVPAVAVAPKHVLALPIYYQGKDPSGELRLETRPGAIIGVVTLGSDGIASGIIECAGEDETAREISQEAQEWAQSKITKILNVLSRDDSSGTAITS